MDHQLKVLYHAGCPDGWVAALSPAFTELGIVERIACKHGEPPPELPDLTDLGVLNLVFVVDFSFPYDVLQGWTEKGYTVTVLDHHQTALEMYQNEDRLEEIRLGKNKRIFRVKDTVVSDIRIEIDLDESGATLAWRDAPGHTPMIVDYVRDKDLWLFELPGSYEISALINGLPHKVEAWEPYLEADRFGTVMDAERLLEAALPVAAFRDKIVEEITNVYKVERLVLPDGQFIAEVPIIPWVPYTVSSTACQRLMDKKGLDLVGYTRTEIIDGKEWVNYGLRSRGEQDGEARRIAELMGGGGHGNAAGFRVDVSGIL